MRAVADSLGGLGIDATDLRSSDRQSWGVRRFSSRSPDGEKIQIKVYSRDANDAQFWSKVWRFIWLRDSGPDLTITRLQQVEHEALIHWMAAQSGATVASVRIAALSPDGDAVLALNWEGTSLGDADASTLTDAALRSLWKSVGNLHAADISHGDLNLDALRLTDENTIVMSELGNGSIAARESRLGSDVAELLIATAAVVGPDRAVGAAADELGSDRLLSGSEYLQIASIAPRNRETARDQKALLASLRTLIAERTDTDLPDPVKLKRVSGRDVLTGVLALIAGYVLISQLAELDWNTILLEVRNAQWVWIGLAFVTAQFGLVTEAISLMAVVERELPAKPTLLLQSASKFVGIALPGPTGRIAMNTAFLRSYGVSPALAVAQGGVESLAGFITETTILLGALLFSDFRLGLNSGQDSNWAAIATLVLVVVAVVLLAIALVPKLRARVVAILSDALQGLSVVLRQPHRIIWVFSATFGYRLVNALTMWFVLRAFGIDLPLSTALFITVAAVLLAGVIPVPGGVGVAEAAIAAGLVAAGIEENVAFAVAVIYRLVQFYLPPAFGYFSLRRLESEGYL